MGEEDAISLRSDTEGVHICIFESLQPQGLFVGDLLHKYFPCNIWDILKKRLTFSLKLHLYST